MAYSVISEHMDADQIEEFDARLRSDPSKPFRRSKGTTQLMGAMASLQQGKR